MSGVSNNIENSSKTTASGEVSKVGGQIAPVWRWLLGIGGSENRTDAEARRHFLVGIGAIALLLAGIDAVNVLTFTHNQPKIGVVPPIIGEATSWIAMLAFAWLPWLALQRRPLSSRPLWLLVAVHFTAATMFSAFHVAGIILLRKAIYALAGHSYRFDPIVPGFLYEWRKDVLAYVVFAAIFWVTERLMRPLPHFAPANAIFDIRDGARIIRVRLDDILAVASAGNYVEFVLRDGRKPLMRSALSAMESELGPRGFLRTHRSWLVNSAQVTGLKPEGSGDYAVELGTLSVPLSRRFPDALAKLRGG